MDPKCFGEILDDVVLVQHPEFFSAEVLDDAVPLGIDVLGLQSAR